MQTPILMALSALLAGLETAHNEWNWNESMSIRFHLGSCETTVMDCLKLVVESGFDDFRIKGEYLIVTVGRT